MGAYDNPQAVRMKIDQGARNIAQFFTAMKGVSDNIARQAAINKKEAEKATIKKEREEEKAKREKEALDNRTGRVISGFDKAYANIESIANEVGDFEVEGAVQQDSIMENLIAMRTKFLENISDPDMGAAEISKIQAQYNNKIAIFKEDIDNFVAGYRVYKDIKDRDLGPNDEDAILSHGEFNEMIPIYESIRTKKGDVGIYPSEDGNSFVVGKFNRTGKKSMSGVDEFEKTPLTASNLTKYREYSQKNGKKNPKFFEQVEIFSPEGAKSRKDYLDQGLKRFSNTQYNFGVKKPVMVKNEKGEDVPKTYVSGQMKGTPVLGDITLDEEKFKDFTKTNEGVAFLLEGIKGQDPESVWVGLGNDPIANPFTKEGLLEALTENLITTYNQPTL